MRVTTILCLSTGLILTVVAASRPQEKKPPDLASKPLSQWIETLQHETDGRLHLQAREALGPDGPYAKVAVPALIDAFDHTEPHERSDVAKTLAEYGPSVVPSLVQALKGPKAPVRAGVAEALGHVRPKALEAVPALREAIKDPVPDVRAAAAGSIGNIGRSADKVIPSLIAALCDKEGKVRAAAADALMKMGRKAKPAVPALIVALKDSNRWVRDEAALVFWCIGPDAKAAVPALIEALQERKNPSDRSMIARTLGGIGSEAREAVPALVEALQEKSEGLREWAARALGEIGPDAKAAVPALIAAVKDNSNTVRDRAIEALGKIGPEARAATPVLMEALAKPASYLMFRYTVAKALGGIGPAARAAVPALTAIARDPFAFSPAREAAAQAVLKIDPAFAAREGLEDACLNVRLGKVPSIKLAPRLPLTEERKQRVKKLIAELANVENPDFGMSATLTGSAFAPLPEQRQFHMGLVTDHRTKTSDALRSLVEIGPDALPFLLEALEDKTPTNLKIEPFGGPLGTTDFGTELEGNPLNPVERRVLSCHPLPRLEVRLFPGKTAQESEEDEDDFEGSYTLKVGDICFVAVGQIVGRAYSAVRYQPSAIVIINSPLERKALRERVRAIWSSKDPAQKLLDSLLLDYATEGIFNGESLDGWSEGNNFQVQAALRLLYYFPQETIPLIAARLRSLDVQRREDSGGMECDVKNRVRAIDFIKTVSWCKAPTIQEALADLAKRTNDPAIKATLGEANMSTSSWILCGLAAFDVVVVTLVFLFLRSQRFMDRKGRMATAIGLSGFVFHAIVFFDGAILYLQLATLAIIFIALASWPFKRRPTDRPADQEPS